MARPHKGRRWFLKSGLGVAASVASVGALSKTGAQTTEPQEHLAGVPEQNRKALETEWVASGYLMATPRGFKSEC